MHDGSGSLQTRRLPSAYEKAAASLVVTISCVLVGLALSRAVRGEARPSVAQAGNSRGGVAEVETVEAILESVQVYVRAGERTRAEALLKGGLAQHPGDQDLRLAYASFLMQDERWEDAFEQYDEASKVGALGATEHFTAGTLASEAARWEDAVRHYDLAQQRDPGDPTTPLYLAQVQLKLGQRDEARASLVRAASLDDTRPEVWGSMAQVELLDNRAELALQHLDKAVELAPEESAWRVMRAQALKRLRRTPESVVELEGLGDEIYALDEGLKLLGEAYAVGGELGRAWTLYEEAVRRRPRDAALLYEAALWAERIGKPGVAIGLAERAVDGGESRASRLVDRLRSDG